MIPVASPDISELEERYVQEAVRSGWVSSIGAFVDRFERDFATFCETEHGVAVSNGTDALLVTLKAAGVGPGDEVIVPALTFVAVPAVVLHLGAQPVLADIHPDYWCLDPLAVERAISPKTKAIVVVHLYGHPADMDPILELARSRRIAVIEDGAEAHGARYKNRRVGSLGDAGCFSFYGNKIITTGEGGMVVTNNAALAERVRMLKDHAMDPMRRYYHPEAGYNCRMTNLQAALGCAQLERIEVLLAQRAQLLTWYREGIASTPRVTLNPKMPWADPVNWMVCVLLDPQMAHYRDRIQGELKEAGIDTRPFFVPLPEMPPYKNARLVGASTSDVPVAYAVGAAGFNMPSSPTLQDQQICRITKQLYATCLAANSTA